MSGAPVGPPSLCPPLVWLVVDDTELQILHEGLQLIALLTDESPELRDIEQALEDRLATLLKDRKRNVNLCSLDRKGRSSFGIPG